MYRIAPRIHGTRLLWAALIATPFVFAACGGDQADAHPVRAGATGKPPADAKVTVTTVAPPKAPTGTAITTTAGAEQPATYANADDVFKAGRYPEAAEMFERYVASKPNDAFGLYMLGLASWKAGDFDRAEEALERSIDINPAFAKAYFNSARVLLDLKRGPEALERVENGLSIDSTSADGWRLKARAQAASGDPDGAKETYRQLLVRNGEDLWGLNNLGVLLLDSGDFPDALGPLARVVQLRPTAPVFQNNFGMALERAGYPVAALHAYESAVRDDSTFGKAEKNLERMRGIVTDTTLRDEVSPQDLAEQFRQRIKMWKDSGTVRPDSSIVKHDTTTRAVPTVGDPIKIRPDSGN